MYRLVAALLLTLCLAVPAVAIDYWPMPMDPHEYTYTQGLVCYYGGIGWTEWIEAPYWNAVRNMHLAGDDLMIAQYTSSSAAMPDPDIVPFSPAVCFLDLPLEVGKTWSTTTLAQDAYTVTFAYAVLEETEVTVPAGTFTVLVLREEQTVDGRTRCSRDYYLNREVGPVILPGGHELVSYQTTPADDTAWGAVKALYR